MADAIEEDLTSLNDATSWFKLRGERLHSWVMHISGTFVGTIRFQMRAPDTGAIISIDTFTGVDAKYGEASGSWDIRAQMTAYGSGTATVRFAGN